MFKCLIHVFKSGTQVTIFAYFFTITNPRCNTVHVIKAIVSTDVIGEESCVELNPAGVPAIDETQAGETDLF